MFGALCSARRAALRSALPPRAPLAGPARGLATRSGALLSPQRTGVSDRTRRKLPLAKAKAKAQASRALLASLESGGQQTRPGDKPLREAIAWATADAYDLKALAASGRLPADWQMLEDDDAIYVPVWPAGVHADAPVGPPGFLGPQGHEAGGEVFVFASGTYVTWGLDEGRSRRFLEDIIRPAGDVEQRRYIHVGDEALEFVWHEEEPTRIVGDVIVLGSAPVEEAEGARWESWTPLQARLAYSQGLSRSARLSAEEDVLDDFLASLANIPEQLEAGGKVPLPRKDVIRKQGTLLRLRQRTNLAKDNFFDSPEGHWDNGSLEHHFDEVSRSMDIESRFRVVNQKLNMSENLLGVLRALLTEQSSHNLELVIIYLIAFETSVTMMSHEYIPTPIRLWRWLTGSSPAPEEAAQAA